MKKSAKLKTAKVSSKSPSKAKTDLPELVAVMMRIAERLDALEKKTDLVLAQTSASTRFLETRQVFPNIQRAEPSIQVHLPQQSGPSAQPNNDQRGRVLHQAVCADCHKDCEVPFKPSGERPVYCKECFSKRKGGSGGNQPQTNTDQRRMHHHERHHKVTSDGPGRRKSGMRNKKHSGFGFRSKVKR